MSTAPVRDKHGFYRIPIGTAMPDGSKLKRAIKLISVTTANSKGWPKGNDDALQMWAAGEAARCALDYLPRLVRQSRTGMDERVEIDGRAYKNIYEFLRHASTRRKDAAGALGNVIHDLIEARILGKPAPEITDEQRPLVDAWHNFEEDRRPEYLATEMVVANPDDGWCGTLDAVVEMPFVHTAHDAGPYCIDWKTGKGDRRRDKCEWPTTGLQLSAYPRATMAWIKQTGEQVDPIDMNMRRAFVVHLRPDHHPGRGYGLVPVDISDGVYRQFLNNIETARFASDEALKLIGSPLPLPTAAEKEIPA